MKWPGVEPVTCRAMTLREVRAAKPIASGYRSERVFELERAHGEDRVTWTLREKSLERALNKVYDSGSVDEWLPLYTESAGPDAFQFVGAYEGEDLIGLATWTRTEWNNSLWLADIRVRPERRRRGAGSGLLTHLRGEATARKCRGIRVETQTTNYAAVSFYLSHGFRIAGFDDHLYTNLDYRAGEVALFLYWENS